MVGPPFNFIVEWRLFLIESPEGANRTPGEFIQSPRIILTYGYIAILCRSDRLAQVHSGEVGRVRTF